MVYPAQRLLIQFATLIGLFAGIQSVSASDEYLRAFSDRHFKGDQKVFTPQSNEATLEKFDNRMASLIYKLPPGRVCALFLDKNFEGPCLELQGTGYRVEIPDLGLYSRNISSLRWEITGGQLSTTEGAFARLYERESFAGRRLTVVFGQDIPDLREGRDDEGRAGFSKMISSARWLIPAGWNLVLYRNRDFKGDALELRGSGTLTSASTLEKFSSRTSSIRWERQRGPQEISP